MKIKTLRDVKLDGRDVPAGTELTEANCTKGEMESLLGSEWAVEVTGKANKPTPRTVVDPNGGNASGDENKGSQGNASEGNDGIDPTLIASMEISKTAIAALKKAGIETIDQAKAYIAQNGSLEPIKGVSKEVADKLAAM